MCNSTFSVLQDFIKKVRSSTAVHVGFLFVILCIMVIMSTGMGYINISFYDAARIIFAEITGRSDFIQGLDNIFQVVIMDVRLPRILTAAVVGSGLAASGVVFQGILLNPLADPYTLGVSAGAAFGASLALLFNLTVFGNFSIPFFAFSGAVCTLAAVIYLSFGSRSATSSLTSNNLILSGIIVTAILSAGISFLKYVADEEVSIIIFWLMGSFTSKTWSELALVLCVVCAGFLIFTFFARDLNLMSLGNRSAASLGVNTGCITLILLISASIVAAICVSVSGSSPLCKRENKTRFRNS